jgi:hypothetical protein
LSQLLATILFIAVGFSQRITKNEQSGFSPIRYNVLSSAAPYAGEYNAWLEVTMIEDLGTGIVQG